MRAELLVDVVEPGLAVVDVVDVATVESEPQAASAHVTAPSTKTRRATRTVMATPLTLEEELDVVAEEVFHFLGEGAVTRQTRVGVEDLLRRRPREHHVLLVARQLAQL